MANLTAKQILKQLHYDLIGKDSYRGVTLTYSWLANQLGHFTLGFVPTFLFFNFLKHFTKIQHPAIWACTFFSVGWFVFELFNFLAPLLKKTSKYAQKNATDNYTFQPAWLNIAYDTATDVCFFWIGTLAASINCESNQILNYILILLGVVVLYPAYDWYTTKMHQQAANYPFQFRLSQWNCNITDEKKSLITQFLQDKKTGKHLLLFGANKTGKTSLAVAIANEMSIAKKHCSYVTAMKLFSLFFEEDTHLPNPKLLDLWVWRKASLLIIDDVNPGLTVPINIINCDQFYQFLNNPLYGNANKKTLTESSIIWVLGNDTETSKKQQEWTLFLQERLAIPPLKITSINLSQAT